MKHFYHNWKLVLCSSAIVALGCLIAAERSAQAQNPAAGWAERDDYKSAKSTMVQFQGLATVLRAGTFTDPAQKQAFTDYYSKYLFPMVTHRDNRQSASDVILKLRNNLATSERAAGQDVFNTLANIILGYMMNVAKDAGYQPAARLNAVLAIGEVNTTAAVSDLLDLIGPAGQSMPSAWQLCPASSILPSVWPSRASARIQVHPVVCPRPLWQTQWSPR